MNARADRTRAGFWRHLRGSTTQTVDRVAVDGLVAFSPVWAAAAIFSLAGDRNMLLFRDGMLLGAITWCAVAVALLLVWRPRWTQLLGLLAAVMLTRYMIAMPVAGNNKMITAFMNAGILIIGVHALLRYQTIADIRDHMYEHMRVVARALLAVMYFYGIFHKINTDFLDPSVSCAVGLYTPLARPFGLEDNLFGRYLAIYVTFVIEAIAIVSLYWKRYFAVGFILALVFHYVIPISAYSWYMDFSSLVFALYVLSIPAPASEALYRILLGAANPLRVTFGRIGILVPGGAVLLFTVTVVMLLHYAYPRGSFDMMVHSVWILIWAAVGGVAMIVLAYVALQNLPCQNVSAPRRPLWVYLVPGMFFLSCLSPYVGLKTESSINMFSNLHTEGGQTNHLLFTKPPYLFSYQNEVVKIVDSSEPYLVRQSRAGNYHILLDLKRRLRWNPEAWVTYVKDGETVTRAKAATFGDDMPNVLERKFLVFKLVDFSRPKVCTH